MNANPPSKPTMTASGHMAFVDHMPFTGHRTVATVWAQQAAARKRERERRPFAKAIMFGFEPDNLKVAK